MNHEEYERAASHWTSLEPEAKRMPEGELRQEVDDLSPGVLSHGGASAR